MHDCYSKHPLKEMKFFKLEEFNFKALHWWTVVKRFYRCTSKKLYYVQSFHKTWKFVEFEDTIDRHGYNGTISNWISFEIKDTKHDCWIISNSDISLPYNWNFHAKWDCKSLKHHNPSTWRNLTNVRRKYCFDMCKFISRWFFVATCKW